MEAALTDEHSETFGQSARKLGEEAASQGQRLAEKARERVDRAAEQRKSAAADFLNTCASAVRQGAHEFEEQGYRRTASFVSGAAEQVEGFGRRLSERRSGDMLEEIEDFARERPAVFIGALFLAGLAGTRFLKSSRPGERVGERSRRHGDPELHGSEGAGAGLHGARGGTSERSQLHAGTYETPDSTAGNPASATETSSKPHDETWRSR